MDVWRNAVFCRPGSILLFRVRAKQGAAKGSRSDSRLACPGERGSPLSCEGRELLMWGQAPSAACLEPLEGSGERSSQAVSKIRIRTRLQPCRKIASLI